MNLSLLTADISNIWPFLKLVLRDGGQSHYNLNVKIKPFRNLFGYSGFDFEFEDGSKGQLAVGIILGSTGPVLRRSFYSNENQFDRFDYFTIKGEISFTADKEALKALLTDSFQMDLNCPILDHLINYLHHEYILAEEGKSKTDFAFEIENFLNTLKINFDSKDPAITTVYQKMLAKEMDPILTWEERQLVYHHYKADLKKVISTKARALRKSKLLLTLSLIPLTLSNFTTRFISRPVDNAKGILYRYTIGKIIWFFQTVKNNLGYSVALAVYGPFTYYFITMPMNPHAMQAVGRVRAVYLETKYDMMRLLDRSDVAIKDMSSKEAIAQTTPASPVIAPQVTDVVSVKAAAPEKEGKIPDSVLANIIYQTTVASPESSPIMVTLDGKNEKTTPSLLSLLLTTDIDSVNKTTWAERMSNFKQMQIAFEENIEYASRMGRLEQLETQYNFPMQVEATWEELERYNNTLFKLRSENPNLSARMKQYLFNEVNRTQQLQLYLWDRMGRFMLDQIYVMLDQDKEQKRNDYYVGRSFVFMQEMTNILSWRYKNFKKPEGYDKIEKLANFYNSTRKEYGTVLKNLAANSDLFKQKDVYSTTEFRSYMKRQWEILFLQNSKVEEAGNMGLNMYIWSVRNTIWGLQSIYSAKREEISLLIKRDTSGQLFSPAEMLARSRVSMLYETLYHNMVLEYVGIREEIKNRLGKDIESTQRQVVLENLKEFLSDRDKLDGLGMANNQKTAGTTI